MTDTKPQLNTLVYESLAAIRARNPRPIIAIDGRGGAGKSTLARAIVSAFPGAAHIEYDWFHRLQSEITGDERYDYQRVFRELITPFKAHQRDFKLLRYNWGYLSGVPDGFAAEPITLAGVEMVVLEGCGVLHPALLESYDYRIWVDTNAEESRARGMRRDIEEYGLDPERVQKAWAEWGEWERAALERHDRGQRADLILRSS
jgi:uridine kinase